MVLNFLGAYWYGLHIYTWLILSFPLLMLIYVWIMMQREWIRKTYYVWRFPEKLIKVVVHYETGLYKIFWRLIPEDNRFKIGESLYKYDDKSIIKPTDIFSKKIEDKIIITVDGVEYNFDKKFEIKRKKDIYPEIHYYFNIPDPINFKKSLDKEMMTAAQLKDFEENLLWSKLLNIESEKLLILLVIILVIINIIFSILIFSVQNQWISFAKNSTGATP